MKTIKMVLGIIIIVLTFLSTISTYIETDIAKRTFEFEKKYTLSQDYRIFYKSIKNLNEITVNTYENIYVTYRQKLALEISIFILICSYLVLEILTFKQIKNNQSKET